jgi:hypothetical protein
MESSRAIVWIYVLFVNQHFEFPEYLKYRSQTSDCKSPHIVPFRRAATIIPLHNGCVNYILTKVSYGSTCGFGLIAYSLLIVTACGWIGSVTPNVTEGQQFAHSVKFPARFHESDSTKGTLPLLFDHYTFRASPKSPNVILVAACKYGDRSEICSTNSFAIDTEYGYGTRPTEAGEWEQGVPIESQEMDDPLRRTLKQEYAKPAFLRAIPFAPGRSQIWEGYKYRGNKYRRRGDWIGALQFASSEDGSLVVLAGVDKRKFPNQKPAAVDTEVYTRLSGAVTIDVFASDPLHHIAALDLDCHTNVNVARGGVSLVGSRWLAIVLDPFLDKMLLFDFKPASAH